MIEHCISSYRKRQENLLYRVYLTDGLKILVEGKRCDEFPRYLEMITPETDSEEQEKSAEEQAEEIKRRINNTFENLGK